VAGLTNNVHLAGVGVQGALPALPVLMSSLGLSLVAVRDRSWRVALAAGFLAGLALGFKQNLAGGVVFAAVLFVASWLAGRLTRPELVRLAGAASIGFAVPVLATIGWALAAGVRLHTLWYAVYGFRFDASRVLSDATDPAPTLRAGLLVLVALGAGMLLIIGGFVVHIRGEWADDAPLTAAVAAMLVVDVVGLVSGGSYWRDYLFPLIPGTALCAALLARRASRRGRAMRTVIIAATASTLLSLVG
jgi:4-amino-4-deoxy-L-arabinose transferase-like glycosyltransferase